jgi:transposase-like protein
MPKPIPIEIRAKVIADRATGASTSEIARRYGVSKAFVSRAWLESGSDLAVLDKPNLGVANGNARTRDRVALAEQIYDTIEEFLSALRFQLRATSDPEWLKSQTAGDIALLLGSESDRAIRLLSGLRPTEQPEPVHEEPDEATG